MVKNNSPQAQMKPVKWGDLILHVQNLSTAFSAKTQQNQFIGANADELVPMGFNSRQFSCNIVFNVLLKNTFPKDFMAFMAKFKSQKAFEFEHPIEGTILCFVKDCNYEINPQYSGGVIISATFAETLTEMESKSVILANNSFQAFDDFEIKNLAEKIDLSPDVKTSLFDTLNQLSQLSDQINGIGFQFSAKMNMMVNKVKSASNGVLNSLNAIGNSSSAILSSIIRKKVELIENKIKTAPRIYITKSNSTIYELCNKFNCNQEKLYEFNPSIKTSPIIKSGTMIYIPNK